MAKMTSNCAALPSKLDIMPCAWFFGLRNRILPPYSPIRLGVKSETAMPAQTARKALAVPRCSSGGISMVHLRVSANQLTGMSMTAAMRYHQPLLFHDRVSVSAKVVRFGVWTSSRHRSIPTNTNKEARKAAVSRRRLALGVVGMAFSMGAKIGGFG